MISYILALAPLLQLDENAPRFVSPHKSQAECFAAAGRLNKQDTRLHSPQARAAGFAYVCLKVELPTV